MLKKRKPVNHELINARRSVIRYPDAHPGLSWTCHICGVERPDRYISVFTREVVTGLGVRLRVNIRYCNDGPDCMAGAPTVTMGGP